MGKDHAEPSAGALARMFREQAAGLAGAVRGVLGPRADAAEVLQEAYLRALRARAAGARPSDPLPWIYVLTLNLARDLRRVERRRGRAVELTEVDAVELRTREAEPATKLARAEALAAARAAIFGLEDPEKEVFLMRVSGELSFQAIADALGIPIGTAKTRMRSALRRLRASLRRFAPEVGTVEMEGGAR